MNSKKEYLGLKMIRILLFVVLGIEPRSSHHEPCSHLLKKVVIIIVNRVPLDGKLLRLGFNFKSSCISVPEYLDYRDIAPCLLPQGKESCSQQDASFIHSPMQSTRIYGQSRHKHFAPDSSGCEMLRWMHTNTALKDFSVQCADNFYRLF